jgi:hypothetical protein
MNNPECHFEDYIKNSEDRTEDFKKKIKNKYLHNDYKNYNKNFIKIDIE